MAELSPERYRRLTKPLAYAQSDGMYWDATALQIVVVIGNEIVQRIDSDETVFPKAAGAAVKVDLDSPTYGWADIIGRVSIRGVGATNPTYAVYRGGIRGYQFAVNDEVFCEFHMPHDYAPGTDVYAHAHWSLATGGVSENVTWGFEVAYSKGHNQAAFGAPVTIATAATASSTTQYQHIITEVQISSDGGSGGTKLDSSAFEPDGLIIMRAYLSANSGATAPFLHFVDLHYQTTGVQGTKNKAPNFYT